MLDKGENAMLEEMRKMIAEQLSCDENEITADTSFKDDLGADSLDLFEHFYYLLCMPVVF